LPHTGYIRLELPVFHVGYFKNIIAILQCVCKTCAHVMVPEDERRQYLRRFRSPQTEVRRLRRLAHAPRLNLACPCRR
jgi:DNA-directed RNA polymerase III subunit RPC1